MRPIELDQARRAVHGRWLSCGKLTSVRGVSIDSRTARPDDLFVAIRGPRHDGHSFLARAADAGCVAAIVAADHQAQPEILSRFDGGVIAVADTTTALGDLAADYRRSIAATVVIVTGSNGKTTVKSMIHHILQTRLSGSCAPSNYNNEYGLPLTLLAVGGGQDYVVCEAGTNAPGQVGRLSMISKPDIAVITSVGRSHLEGLGSIERVAIEKASVMVGLSPNGFAVAWADSEHLRLALRAYDARVAYFGASDSADLRLTHHRRRGWGQQFELNGRLQVSLPLPGRHNAMNALAAITTAQRFGIDQESAAEALADFAGGPGRLERMSVGDVTVIHDAYNANPDSMLAAGEVLAGCRQTGRRVMIAGDMKELGEQTEQLHRQVGQLLAQKEIHVLIGVGPLGRIIASSAEDAGAVTAAFDTLDEACKGIEGCLEPGDVVLVKGSRAMRMEELIASIRSAFAGRGSKANSVKTKGRKR